MRTGWIVPIRPRGPGNVTSIVSLSDASIAARSDDSRATASFGLRRRFTVDSSSGGVLYSHAYWTGQGPDFFLWLAARAEDPEWRSQRARVWTEGLAAAVLRSD